MRGIRTSRSVCGRLLGKSKHNPMGGSQSLRDLESAWEFDSTCFPTSVGFRFHRLSVGEIRCRHHHHRITSGCNPLGRCVCFVAPILRRACRKRGLATAICRRQAHMSKSLFRIVSIISGCPSISTGYCKVNSACNAEASAEHPGAGTRIGLRAESGHRNKFQFGEVIVTHCVAIRFVCHTVFTFDIWVVCERSV